MERNAGGWFGGQIGATVWMFVAGALTAFRDVPTGMVVVLLFAIPNGIDFVLWQNRKLSCYASAQLLIGISGVCGFPTRHSRNQNSLCSLSLSSGPTRTEGPAMNPLVERHQDKIAGVFSCFDRVVITGTLPDTSYAGAMAGYLSYHKIRLFDDPRWAEPLRDELRDHAKQLAFDAGIEIEFIRRHKAFRKEDRVKAIINARGDRPGRVHIFSAMEACTATQKYLQPAGSAQADACRQPSLSRLYGSDRQSRCRTQGHR
jgi:hypothetical protein